MSRWPKVDLVPCGDYQAVEDCPVCSQRSDMAHLFEQMDRVKWRENKMGRFVKFKRDTDRVRFLLMFGTAAKA